MSRLGSSSSYYMGISYRSTNRLNQQLQMSKSANLNNLSVNSVNPIKEIDKQLIKAIHTQKIKRKVEQITKHRNPYLLRKQSQSIKKNRKSIQKDPSNSHEHLKQFFKVTRIKTENNQSKQTADLNNPLMKRDNLEEKNLKEEKQININTSQNDKNRKQNQVHKIIRDQNNSLFHHFPSHLFNEPHSSKSRLTFQKRNSSYARKSNFFFPSSKVRQSPEKSKSAMRPTSAAPRRKKIHESELFNFDGTLQNHQIIPQRPKTADNRKNSKYYSEHIQYLNYKVIASRCIRRKNSKASDKELKILPWGSRNEDRPNVNLMDLSYSTIRDQLMAQI